MKIRNDITIAGLSREETIEFLKDKRYSFNNIEDFITMKKQVKRLKKFKGYK